MIIGANKKENPLLTKNYSYGVLNEYMASRGMKIVNLENTFVLEDLERFIKERTSSNDKYRKFLDGLTIDYRDSDTIESVDSREFIISSSCDCDTTIASRDRKISDTIRRDRVIPGNIKIYNGVPVIAYRVWDGYYYKVVLDNFRTIMKTNPIVSNIKYFRDIKEVSGHNIILGVNGSIYDRDRKDKLFEMDKLANNLDNNYVKFQYEDNDDYLYIIASRELKRIK